MSNGIISIQYFEKPVTIEEKEIAALLEKMVQAITAKDIDLLVSLYSDAASIEMLASRGVPISKSEYRERMSKSIEGVRNIYFRNTIIRVNEQEAVISCRIIVLLRGRVFPEKNQIYFKCIKDRGEWLIIETRYI